jgi:putative transposase
LDARLLELIAEAEALRKQHPGCGVEKMYHVLQPGFIGRDRFIELMMEVGFRLKRSRNYKRTTYGTKVHYQNLIKGINVSAPSTVWQSDITYIPVGNEFYYAVFIIDVYSKKIVGHQISKSMRAIANVRALEMALRSHKAPDIHHSDRGSQYIANEYVSMLKSHNTQISMGLIAQDNAYAERINRTIKEEYLTPWKIKTYAQLKSSTSRAVAHYNHKRQHNHLKRMTPVSFEQRCLTDKTFQKPIITIFDETISKTGQH